MKPMFKQPSEAKIWTWNFAPDLGGEAIASILSVTVAARGRVAQVLPLVIGAQGYEGQQARARLDDGTDGESYLVSVKVADAAGQKYELDAEFLCVDLSWAAPDGSTPYLSIAEFVEEVGYEEAIRLTDELQTGRIDKARLIAVIEAAQAVADGYLASRYSVPLAAAPQIVKSAVLDLARRRLYRLEAPEGVKLAAADAMANLKAIAKGDMRLPQAEEPAASPTTVSPVLVSTAGRTYPPGSLDSY